MRVIKRGFYHRSMGTVKVGTEATQAHEDLMKRCNMDVDRYIGGEKKQPSKKKEAKKEDE